MELTTSRRDLLLESLATTMPLSQAAASPIDPARTIVKLPGELAWNPNPDSPPRIMGPMNCKLTDPTSPGRRAV
jgi:hypothetical protein